ncbi:MAG: hypothetical protein RMJ18_02635 [Candidatus Aenigmarchaeota archaeon]|nr:hypothetical protein [Candidatus Aenigmarchaeota archaeon]MDW8160288.1 hypothetical protein [Candidatus Aenigmarchaeota archaeon]
MPEMAITFTVFAVILLVALIIIAALQPRLISFAVNAVNNMIKQVGCILCKSALGWASALCFGCW